jgi:hypothetical protein
MFAQLSLDEKKLAIKNLFKSPEHTEFAIWELEEYEKEKQNNKEQSKEFAEI